MTAGPGRDPRAWDQLPATEEEIAALREPVSAEEREATLSLVRWFTRRYPTYEERAVYIRRKWREAEMLRRAGVVATLPSRPAR